MKYKVSIVSLGCDKNLINSEQMMGLLENDQFIIEDNLDEAQIIIVNTCAFIESAKKESIDAILDVADFKLQGKCKVLMVTGCMAQRYKEEMLKEIPEVDAVIGTGSYHEIVNIIYDCLIGKKVERHGDINLLHESKFRVQTTPQYTAYLKIAEGCDNFCTYCVIPKIRGKYRSRKIESILDEAKKIVDDGVKEIILIAQDTTRYGLDLNGEPQLPKLLDELCKIDNLKWIRLMYCYPEGISDQLIETIKKQDKVLKYLDIPIQHSNDEILKLMGRKSTKKNLEDLIAKLKANIPGIAIRTSIIVGFPGETTKHFNDLVDFIKNVEFDRLGVFSYSKEEGTPAYKFKNQIPKNIKEKRLDKLMFTQQEISYNINQKFVGQILEVLVEGVEDDVYYGRTYRDAPEIDGQVYFKCKSKLEPGDFVNVKINEADQYDLMGEIMYEPGK